MSSGTPSVLLDGLYFPEGPRWHDGRLFFSDFYAHEVVAMDPSGKRESIVSVPNQPSGLGWTPDGRLLVVSMLDRRLLRLDSEGLAEVADLSALATSHCNDMVVDGQGRAYIGNFGFDRHQGEEPTSTCVLLVQPDGTVEIADSDLFFPNGSAITEDGETLIVAESWKRRLTAWERDSKGRLSRRRVWAELGDQVPDGISLDAEGAIWVADPRNKEAFRVHEGGEITERVSTGDQGCYACMLGGDDRRTLFLCTAKTSGPEAKRSPTGRIESVRVEVPGTGWP